MGKVLGSIPSISILFAGFRVVFALLCRSFGSSGNGGRLLFVGGSAGGGSAGVSRMFLSGDGRNTSCFWFKLLIGIFGWVSRDLSGLGERRGEGLAPSLLSQSNPSNFFSARSCLRIPSFARVYFVYQDRNLNQFLPL
jgi:hypothetical protein